MNEAEASSHQPKKRGRKATYTPEESRARKRACDNNRYHRTQEKLKEIEGLTNELKLQKGTVEEMQRQMDILKEENAQLVSYKEEKLKEMQKQMDILKEENAQLVSHKEVTEDDLKNMDVPWDKDFLDGEENWSMVSALFEHIPNVIDDLPADKLITEGAGSSRTGIDMEN